MNSTPPQSSASLPETDSASATTDPARTALLDALNELLEAERAGARVAMETGRSITDPELERTRERIILTGDVPSPLRPPPGCVFNTRCPIAIEECRERVPEWREVVPEHWVACHRV